MKLSQTTWTMKSATSTYHCRVYFLILPLDALDLLLAVLVLLAVSEITLEVKVLFKISKVYGVLNIVIVVICIYVFFVPYYFRLCSVSSTANTKHVYYQILFHIWLPSDQNRYDLPATPGITKTVNMKEE